MREVVAVAVRVVLRSSQAGSRPGAQEGLVPYLVDLAEKDLVDLAERLGGPGGKKPGGPGGLGAG